MKQAGIARGRVLTAAAATLVLAAGLLTWLLWPAGQQAPGAERVRQYTDVRASRFCMRPRR